MTQSHLIVKEEGCTKPNCDCMQRHADKHGLDVEQLKSYECFGSRLIEHTAEKDLRKVLKELKANNKELRDSFNDPDRLDFRATPKSESPEIDKEEEQEFPWLIETNETLIGATETLFENNGVAEKGICFITKSGDIALTVSELKRLVSEIEGNTLIFPVNLKP